MRIVLFFILNLAIKFSFSQIPTDLQLSEIESFMAPLRARLMNVLQTDHTGQYKVYLEDVKTLVAEKDLFKKKQLIDQLSKQHLSFIRNAFSNAGLDRIDFRTTLIKILGHANFKQGEFGDFRIDYSPVPNALGGKLRFESSFEPPFEALEEVTSSTLGGFCTASAQGDALHASAEAIVDGGCRAKAFGGINFTIPFDIDKITVLGQSDLEYYGVAVAVIGYSQIKGKWGIRLKYNNIEETIYTKEVFALSPLIWFMQIEGEQQNFIHNQTFSGVFSTGTNVTAQLFAEARALTFPLDNGSDIYVKHTHLDQLILSGKN